MRNKVTPAEAAVIGARAKAARLRLNQSLQEVGLAAGLHHSQVSRCERGSFKVISNNVQRLCVYLRIAHPKLTKSEPSGSLLTERFNALIESLPGSATAFARLFDVIESSGYQEPLRKHQRRTST